MRYYHIELYPGAKKLCTIVLLWVKYYYQKLPMGVRNSPDIFQEKISEIFEGFDMVCEYIGDVLITTQDNFTDHLKAITKVLHRLVELVLKLNVGNYFF